MIASHLSRISLLAVAHAAGREAPVHELAPLPVLGVVHVDHHRDRARCRDGCRPRSRTSTGPSTRRAPRRSSRGPTRCARRRSRRARSRASTCTSGAGRRRRRRRRAGRCRAPGGWRGHWSCPCRSVFQVGSGGRIAQHLAPGSGGRGPWPRPARDRRRRPAAATRSRAPGRAGSPRCPPCPATTRCRTCRGTASVPVAHRLEAVAHAAWARAPACPARARAVTTAPRDGESGRASTYAPNASPATIATSLNMSSPCSPRIAPCLLSVTFICSHGPSDGSPASTNALSR